MVLLFVYLAINRRVRKSETGLDPFGVPENLAKVADALLSHLSLLFVPAGVGVMVHFSLLKNDWLPLSAGIIGSTILTISVTAGVMVWLSRFSKEDNMSSGRDQ
jgi:holin-like protein